MTLALGRWPTPSFASMKTSQSSVRHLKTVWCLKHALRGKPFACHLTVQLHLYRTTIWHLRPVSKFRKQCYLSSYGAMNECSCRKTSINWDASRRPGSLHGILVSLPTGTERGGLCMIPAGCNGTVHIHLKSLSSYSFAHQRHLWKLHQSFFSGGSRLIVCLNMPQWCALLPLFTWTVTRRHVQTRTTLILHPTQTMCAAQRQLMVLWWH